MSGTSQYPRRPLVDSSVLIAAWTKKRAEPARDDCIAFLEGVEAEDGEILIAAPTITELLKGTPPLELPRRKSVVPVPFDARAARNLAKLFPPTVLQAIRDENGHLLAHYIKYDAMIVACAKTFGADCIITLNGKCFDPLARHIGLQCHHPRAYKKAHQLSLVSSAGVSGTDARETGVTKKR